MEIGIDTAISPPAEESPARWWALGAIGLALLAVGLDVNVLNIALPTMSTALHASLSDLQWFSAGYTLVMAAMLLPAGLFGDRLGRKKLLLTALALFGGCSLWCAYSTSSGELIVARMCLGLAAAFLTPLASAVFLVLFPRPEERTKAMAVLSSAIMLGLPLGPVAGGALLEHFWWGSVFLINVPLVLIGVTAVALLVPESRGEKASRLDYGGILASSAGLVGITYGLIEFGQYGWGSPRTLVPFLVGVALLGLLVRWERHMARVGNPLIDLTLFRSRSFSWGTFFIILVSFALFGLIFFLPLYYQSVQGSDTLRSGLKLLPLVGGVLVGAIATGKAKADIGTRAIPALGFAITAAGLFLGANTKLNSGYGFTVIWLVIMGIGLGMAMTTTMTAALNELSTERAGVGSALVQALRAVGGALGVALLGSFANSGYRSRLTLPPLPAPVTSALRGSVATGVQVASRLHSTSLLDLVRSAFVGAMDITLWVCGGLCALAAVLALLFLRPSRRSDDEDEG